jgi:hypothetical protein
VQLFTKQAERRASALLIGFNWNVLQWPGVNQAFLFSLFVSSALALLAVPYAKRRPVGTPTSWGEAMLAAVFAFGVMFIAFGVVPHQWIDHADKELGWNRQKLIYGPGDVLKPEVLGGRFPFTISYEAIRDTVVVLIHVWYFGLTIYLWKMWQSRGDKKPGTEVATSSYGRPLVKKA